MRWVTTFRYNNFYVLLILVDYIISNKNKEIQMEKLKYPKIRFLSILLISFLNTVCAIETFIVAKRPPRAYFQN